MTTAEGALIGEVTSNQNGYATLDNLEPGTYIVSEIKGPDGFILDNTPHTVVVKKNETATVEIANTPMSTLEIRKVDSVTGKPLSGITFEVEKLSGERIGTFVTDAAGRIVIPDLTPQWVVVKETKTRPGYKLDPDPVNVEIKSGKTTVVKFQNQPYPVLDLLKVDAETGKPMEGVKFRLLDSQKREIGVFTTNRNGRITLTGLDGGTTVYWQEVETMKGYELDESLHKVSLQWARPARLRWKMSVFMENWRFSRSQRTVRLWPRWTLGIPWQAQFLRFTTRKASWWTASPPMKMARRLPKNCLLVSTPARKLPPPSSSC